MFKQRGIIVILCAVCIIEALLFGYAWYQTREVEAFYARQHSNLNNWLPFCMKVAHAYTNGDTEQIVQLTRSKNASEVPGLEHLEAYKGLDLAFDGLDFPWGYLDGGRTFNCVIRYRLLSEVPSKLTEIIPPERIEHRDGKDYVYQCIIVFYEEDKVGEENQGWSYVSTSFDGEPFSQSGDETRLHMYA